MVDGEDQGYIEKGKPLKIELTGGEHYLQLFHAVNGAEKADVIEVPENKQIVHRVSFDLPNVATAVSKIPVVDSHSTIPGLTHDQNDYGAVTYHGFEKGDKIHLSFKLENKKGKANVTVFSYPGLNVLYSKNGIRQLDEIEITVKDKGIYGIQLTTAAILNRTAHLRVWRTPKSKETADFNTEVRQVEIQEPVMVIDDQSFIINSDGNATFLGGKSRIVLPVSLPRGTSKWYYRISASRNKAIIEQAKNTSSLFQDLSMLIDQSGLLSGVIGLLTDPPGADVCDIYLLDAANTGAFLNKEGFRHYREAGRLNFAHGNVEVDFVLPGEMYLGIENPANLRKIHLLVNVVAIVSRQELQMVD
ncbi:MAG: hypothetical protein Roseis2KO_43750 [Roseivirga sp.]